jgi:hypothetical protein
VNEVNSKSGLLLEGEGSEATRLDGEERHQIYRMLRLQVHVSPDGNLDVRGVLREAVCTPMDTPLRILQNTSGSELRFHARLSGGACHDSS